GKLKGRIGPELTIEDINALKVGSIIYHKIDRVGRVIATGPTAPPGAKRFVEIRFASNVHSGDINNATKNYCRWILNGKEKKLNKRPTQADQVESLERVIHAGFKAMDLPSDSPLVAASVFRLHVK